MIGRTCRFGLALVMALLLPVVLPSLAEAKAKKSKKAGPYRISANAALLMDKDRQQVYYSRSIEEKVFPASTTKVMTAIVVMERLGLDTVVTVSPKATDVLPSKVDLKAGEKYRVRDLLFATLLNSANDASVALAIAAAGSQDEFVALMNKKALALGARHTVFANCHGLPDRKPQYTTAFDMYLIFREALKSEFFREAIKIRTMTVRSLDDRPIALRSHNKALFKGWKQNVYGKTGYTRAAQACFIGVVQKKDRPLIVAVFGCPGSTRWKDIKYIVEHYGGVDL